MTMSRTLVKDLQADNEALRVTVGELHTAIQKLGCDDPEFCRGRCLLVNAPDTTYNGNLIDLLAEVRTLKADLTNRYKQDYTIFRSFMEAVLPAANIAGEPGKQVGWQHVVQRVKQWRSMLTQQLYVLELLLRAATRGLTVEEMRNTLRMQHDQMASALDLWEPGADDLSLE